MTDHPGFLDVGSAIGDRLASPLSATTAAAEAAFAVGCPSLVELAREGIRAAARAAAALVVHFRSDARSAVAADLDHIGAGDEGVPTQGGPVADTAGSPVESVAVDRASVQP